MTRDDLLSRTIGMLRFPLTVAVVFIHFSLTDGLMVHGVKHGLDNPAWFFHIVNLCSEVMARIAVPLFYMFSGFLFFYRVDDFDGRVYRRKLTSRARTLLVPFVLWNIIAVVWQLKCMLPGLSSFYRPVEVHFSLMRVINTFLFNTGNSGIIVGPELEADATGSYPIDVPLWFLRDLMVMVILTPLVHWLIKRGGRWPVVVLGAMWLLAALFIPRGCYIDMLLNAAFFFTMGAACSIGKVDFVQLCRRFKWSPVLYLAIAVIDTLTKGADFNIYIHRAGILVGMAAVINISSLLIERRDLKVNPTLAGSSFFIFASHYLLIGDTGKLAFTMLHVPENNPLAMLALYFIVPLVVTGACLVAYAVLKRVVPQVCNLLSGGR